MRKFSFVLDDKCQEYKLGVNNSKYAFIMLCWSSLESGKKLIVSL